MTVGPTDTAIFTEEFAVSVLAGYSCIGNMIVYGTIYANHQTNTLIPNTFAIHTGVLTIDATWGRLGPVASWTPQVIEFVHPLYACLD